MASATPPNLLVSFLPWISLDDEICLGKVTLWPFRSASKDKIREPAVQEHLEKYFECYVDHQGRPVRKITICSYGDVDFRALPKAELQDLRHVVDALLFISVIPEATLAVSENNPYNAPPSAENFELVHLEFLPGKELLTVVVGNCQHMGYTTDMISFQKPWAASEGKVQPSDFWAKAFHHLFDASILETDRGLIFRSLEWFRLAHFNSDDISPLSKVLMMATAFEVLLAVPPDINQKKRWIAEELERWIETSKFIRGTRTDNKGKTFLASKLGWWAWDFYELRNAIVHGDQIQPRQLEYRVPGLDWLTHLMVADLVFGECIARKLFRLGCFEKGQSFRALSPGHPEEAFIRFFRPLFGDFFEALSWMSSQECTNSIPSGMNKQP